MSGLEENSSLKSSNRLPFGFGSVSLALYVHDLSPAKALNELFDQVRHAFAAGFDGVTLAEHHNGFRSYLPMPLQVIGWLLENFQQGWAATYPLVVPLRPVELLVEELAWLAARFPRRLGLVTSPGYVKDDFAATGAEFARRFSRYWASMEVLMDTLNGQPLACLAQDPAVVALKRADVPVLAAATGHKSIANAGRLGLGIAPPGEDNECIRIFTEYAAAGGTGPMVLNRWPWIRTVGADLLSPDEHAADAGSWQSKSSSLTREADRSWLAGDPKRFLQAETADLLAEQLNQSIAHCSATCLNIRLHNHNGEDKSPEAVKAMIDAFAEVIPLLRFPAPMVVDVASSKEHARRSI